MHVSQPPAHDQLFQTKNLKSYEKSRLPPGIFFWFLFIFYLKGDAYQDPPIELECIQPWIMKLWCSFVFNE